MHAEADALVIGAGPAGSAVARRLAAAGWETVVIEKAAFPRRKVCGEFISPATMGLLASLGVGARFEREAGPAVRKVGLFAAGTLISAPMPGKSCPPAVSGRALDRERLDAILLQSAVEAGARVLQPCSVQAIERDRRAFTCIVMDRATGRTFPVRARVVVAAHGSWEAGRLPTQPPRGTAASADLFGFKTHLRSARLTMGLMPLIAFPGGYGGMVHTSGGRVSLSFCVRRDVLERCRAEWAGAPAGEAVLQHIRRHCAGVRETIDGAGQAGGWLSAGPIRPGVRGGYSDGVFLVGNAAGEAHPAAAEGISMALQGASVLCDTLLQHGISRVAGGGHDAAGREYARRWRRNFAGRIHASRVIARLAMSPRSAVILPVLRAFPGALTLGARFCGKA